ENGELSHGPTAEYRDGISVLDLRQVCAEVAGGKNIGEQNGLVIAHVVRQLYRTDVGVRNPRVLGLQALERTGCLGTAEERCACLDPVRIGIVALRVVAAAAVRTRTAGYGGRYHHPIAHLEVAYPWAEFLDYPHRLVAEYGAWPHS